jgi:uncharacterized protein (TIGR02171 family)
MEKTSYLFILFLLLVGGCENHTLDISEDKPEAIDGMIFVQGGMATLGSNDPEFKASERPAMKVKLDYDFYLAIHELTCGEYRALAKEQKLKDFGKCENDSLPLANVTYYDAVLYANAKSKSENRDTSYTYSKATYDSEGHCTYLDAFVFHSEIKAYRLPTEAEWVLAASKGWNPAKFSWNANNSEYRAHDVCSAGADAFGFCDLAGNVKEWVNDWAGHFQDTTVTNYVGSLDGGDLGERVLKGGFYSEKPSEMNTVARGDDYTVEASTRAERIGFRLAFGQIPSPTWLDANGKAKTSVVSALADAAALKKLTGTYNAILVFRNDISGNLAYINYNAGNLSVTEIYDSIEVYHPDISPDGKHVAFCTKPEGISGISELYVRDLNAKGTHRIKLDVKSAAIPRWRIQDNGDTVIVYVTDAGNNKDESAFKETSTWQVKFENGKFGTPKKLFNGAYHGGISEDNTLAVSGARLLRARLAKKGSTITEKARDTIWYDKQQACNASLAQDRSKRTAFLDFSGEPGEDFVGESYTTHERIFIADSTGKLIQSIKSPKSYTFDHSEWASNGETSNIVATLTNINGAHTKIVLANPSDSSILELAEGVELWHPCLWVERKTQSSQEASSEFVLDPDSAGIYYNNSGASSNAGVYRYKMELLWQYKDSANTVILGSSRAYRGVNPDEFGKEINAVNLAVSAATILGNKTLFENYVLSHFKKLKIVITSIDIDRGYISGLNDNNIFYTAYKSYPGYVYDMNHNFWKDGYPKELYQVTFDSPGPQNLAKKLREHRGFFASDGSAWGTPIVTEDSCWMDKKSDIYKRNLQHLTELLEICKENNIYLIAVLFPVNPKYQETGAYGYAGLRRSEAAAVIKEISDLEKVYPNFVLMDENKMGNHDYTDNMANDNSHLSTKGAQKLTHRLDSLIQTLDIDFNSSK